MIDCCLREPLSIEPEPNRVSASVLLVKGAAYFTFFFGKIPTGLRCVFKDDEQQLQPGHIFRVKNSYDPISPPPFTLHVLPRCGYRIHTSGGQTLYYRYAIPTTVQCCHAHESVMAGAVEMFQLVKCYYFVLVPPDDEMRVCRLQTFSSGGCFFLHIDSLRTDWMIFLNASKVSSRYRQSLTPFFVPWDT